MFPHEEADQLQYLQIRVLCLHFDLQVSAMTQISNSLGQMFSAVEHPVLEHDVHSQSSEEHNVVDRIEWRKFLRPLRNVKTLRIEDGLVVCNWTMESSLWTSYPNCTSSHILGILILIMNSLDSLVPPRTRVTP
jgi:hypothetical protein